MAARLTLYTRKDCHLCDEARGVLDRVRRNMPFDLDVVNIDSSEALAAQYGEEVPVVLIDGRKRFKYRVDEQRLRRLLEAETP